MTVEDMLKSSLDHPDINQTNYWTNDPTHIEEMRQGDSFIGYLITHETETIEVCLLTCAAKAFARCRKTGATLYRVVSASMCREVSTRLSGHR